MSMISEPRGGCPVKRKGSRAGGDVEVDFGEWAEGSGDGVSELRLRGGRSQ